MKTQNEFHQNGCSVWLLGCKVEQCKNVSLINTANGDSHCSGRRALLLQDTVGEYQDAKQLQCCNSLLGVSILESPRKHFRGDLKKISHSYVVPPQGVPQGPWCHDVGCHMDR